MIEQRPLVSSGGHQTELYCSAVEMRIFMLVPRSNIQGGTPKILPHLISALRSLGCYIVTAQWGRQKDTESLAKKVLGRVRDIARIRQSLLYQEFDVMLINTSHDWATLSRDIPLLLVTRCLCRHILLLFHGSKSGLLLQPGHMGFKQASALLLRLSDAVLVLSSEEQRQWEQFYPSGKFFVVSNPFVSAVTSVAPSCPGSWNLRLGIPVLLFVGRLVREKGIFDLLDAMARLTERTPCHLLVVGNGPAAQQLQEQVVSLGLSDCVTLTGYLEGSVLAEAYQTSDIFVLPTYWDEGFPAVIVEAMNGGLPIVTTRIRGAADHLQEGVNALFVPPRNPVVLADTLVRLLADPVLRAQMSCANREKVKDFTPEVVGRHYLNVLQAVIGTE